MRALFLCGASGPGNDPFVLPLMTMESSSAHDFVIIGGGILGLATARALATRHPARRLLILEKEHGLAAHQTGHNSGVIHSGLYYKPGSAKARLCVRGVDLMLDFCREHGIRHEQCGKVVVAVDNSELPRLEELERRGLANGIPKVERIGPERLRELEPCTRGVAALHIPSTGIVDYPEVCAKIAEGLRAQGTEIRTGARVTGSRDMLHEMILETTTGDLRTHFVVNCAGLQSDRVARLLGARPDVKIIPFRGEYYQFRPGREGLVRNLIYPVPNPEFPFLGVHFTRMVHGGVEAGPNAVLALKREGYTKSSFDLWDALECLTFPGFLAMSARYWHTGFGEVWRSLNKGAFVSALRRLLPELSADDLVPGGSGVRAQAVRSSGALLDDFEFLTGGRALHVLNAPSPAATASLAIGEEIAREAERVFAF